MCYLLQFTDEKLELLIKVSSRRTQSCIYLLNLLFPLICQVLDTFTDISQLILTCTLQESFIFPILQWQTERLRKGRLLSSKFCFGERQLIPLQNIPLIELM